MTEYTIIFCIASDKHFLLVEKDKPEWQKGKLNLPGGKIEPGETPIQCANRELAEESGLCGDNTVHYMKQLGRIVDNNVTIHCMWCCTSYSSKLKLRPADSETQKIGWYDWDTVRRDRRLIPNLRLIIPLMLAGQNGWCIEDHDTGFDKEEHKMTISVPGGMCKNEVLGILG